MFSIHVHPDNCNPQSKQSSFAYFKPQDVDPFIKSTKLFLPDNLQKSRATPDDQTESRT